MYAFVNRAGLFLSLGAVPGILRSCDYTKIFTAVVEGVTVDVVNE